ncbi:uncharacterized protein N7482_008808 [Penicillium canariense]|uniref:HTH CENPB-type domain-containing protein n=1 Tax=Penicillium canariense TaxID=189055 RepID=A0A9W9LIW6_9EURO|nr:uncharacterized protein N7482_008808 [Penicillium canariense]KAJ5157708.1 hypothetical protein N7482_008808 [Penicillium canariense]
MPPQRSKHSNESSKPADRLAIAIIGLKSHKFSSIREAARHNDVPEATLRTRFRAMCRRADARPRRQALTETEENTLHNWIVSLLEGGFSLDTAIIQEMANTLRAKRDGRAFVALSEKWVVGFVKGRPQLAAWISRNAESSDSVPLRTTSASRVPDAMEEPSFERCEIFIRSATETVRMQYESELAVLRLLEGRLGEPGNLQDASSCTTEVDDVILDHLNAAWGCMLTMVGECDKMAYYAAQLDTDNSGGGVRKAHRELRKAVGDVMRVRGRRLIENGGKPQHLRV